MLARLTVAEQRWSAAAPNCSSYRYDRRFESVFGYWRDTIVRVDATGVASREHTWGGGGQPEGSWTEDRTAIGTHPSGNLGQEIGFPPSTVDQLLAECRNVLEKASEGSTFALHTNAQGVPVACLAVFPRCVDDCATNAIHVPYFACDEPWDPVDLSGSYDVTLTGADRPPATIRLHLGRSNQGIDGYLGTVAAYFATPCLVTLEADAIGIQRCERAQGDFRLMRRPDGSLDGTATGSWMNRVGTVAKYAAPPMLEVAPSPSSEPRPLLPWRPIPLTFGDAVSFQQLRQLLTIRTDRAATVPAVLVASPPANLFNSWVGAPGATATFAWDDIANSTLTFDVASGLVGFSGATAGALSLSVAIPSVGAGVVQHDFLGPTIDVATWGAAALATADPGCDTGTGCLGLGAPLISCQEPGVGGLLAAPPDATSLEIRVRLVGPGGSSPVRMALTMIPEGGQPTPGSAKIPLPRELIDLGPAAGEGRFASEWTNIEFPLPAVPTPARWAFELQLSTDCSPLAPVTSLPDRVLIDSVRIH